MSDVPTPPSQPPKPAPDPLVIVEHVWHPTETFGEGMPPPGAPGTIPSTEPPPPIRKENT